MVGVCQCRATAQDKLKRFLTRARVALLLSKLKNSPWIHPLVGLVVKASTLRAGDPGFESRLRRDFFGVESYQ